MMKTYLALHGTVYHFRFLVPPDIQPHLGLKTIKVSLDTGKKIEARRKAKQMACAAKQLFKQIRGKEMIGMDQKELQELLRKYLDRLLAQDELLRAMPVQAENLHEIEPKGMEMALDGFKRGLANSDFTQMKPFIQEFVAQNGLDLQEGSLEYFQVARGLNKTMIDFFNVALLRSQGDTAGEREYLKGLAPATTPPPVQITLPQIPEKPEPAEVHMLSDLIKEYLDSANHLKNRTKKNYGDSLGQFLEVVGDLPIHKVDHGTIREFKKIMEQLPPHYKKTFPGKSIQELLKMEHEKKQELKTIDDKIKVVSGLFNWCVNQGYMEMNFATGKGVRGSKKIRSTHEIYTDEDLQKLFNAPEYVNDTFKQAWKFWMPLLALYTGARQSELAQMRCEDVLKIDGIWCIKVAENEEDKFSSVKSAAAWRDVPLHPVLVDELRFPEYVESVRKKGHERVFHDLKPKNGSYGQRVSEWYGEFKRSVGIQPSKPGNKKDFHSFRNTFINAAKQAGADGRKIEETVGHSEGKKSMSMDYYAQAYSVAIRYEDVVKRIRFGISIKPLMNSRIIKEM